MLTPSVLTRRHFLGLGIGGTLAASAIPAACSPSGPVASGELGSVVVVGGGISGLVSAYLLSRGRTEVTILDANNHAGGRVHTERWANGQTSELCFQEFFERSTYPDVWWLVDELDLNDQVAPYPGAMGAFLRDEYLAPSSYSKWIRDLPWKSETDARDFASMTAHVSDSIGLWSMPRDTAAYAELDAQSMRDWILESYDQSGSGDVDWLTSIFLRPEVGVQTGRTSAAYAILNLWIWFNSNLSHLRDGNDQFITRLLERLRPGALTLDARVSSVRNLADDDGVEVEYRDAAGSHSIRADAAIVAVPHPVVRQIVPDLPAARKEALSKLDFARIIRHNGQYTERVWETRHDFRGSGVYTDKTATWITNSPPGDFESGVFATYIDDPVATELWTGPTDDFTPHIRLDDASGLLITNRLHQDLSPHWPEMGSALGEARVWQVPYYGPVYPPRYVLDGHYELNREPFGNIHFGGDWVYGFGANDAVHRGRDVAAELTPGA